MHTNLDWFIVRIYVITLCRFLRIRKRKTFVTNFGGYLLQAMSSK